jgi:hypothetical protein
VTVRIGSLGRGLTFDEIARNVEEDQVAGYSSVWFSDGIGMDPLTLIGALGRQPPQWRRSRSTCSEP